MKLTTTKLIIIASTIATIWLSAGILNRRSQLATQSRDVSSVVKDEAPVLQKTGPKLVLKGWNTNRTDVLVYFRADKTLYRGGVLLLQIDPTISPYSRNPEADQWTTVHLRPAVPGDVMDWITGNTEVGRALGKIDGVRATSILKHQISVMKADLYGWEELEEKIAFTIAHELYKTDPTNFYVLRGYDFDFSE